MSRCSICDYSQSADSIYNNGLSFQRSLVNNRVVYSPSLGIDICVRCLENHTEQANFWESFSEEEDVFEVQVDEGSDYQGCTEIKTD